MTKRQGSSTPSRTTTCVCLCFGRSVHALNVHLREMHAHRKVTSQIGQINSVAVRVVIIRSDILDTVVHSTVRINWGLNQSKPLSPLYTRVYVAVVGHRSPTSRQRKRRQSGREICRHTPYGPETTVIWGIEIVVLRVLLFTDTSQTHECSCIHTYI